MINKSHEIRLIYEASDNSGFIIYNTFNGETRFFETKKELEEYKAVYNISHVR